MTETQRRNILVETVKAFGKQQWFRDASVYDAYPTTGEPTLELKVNYIPMLEKKMVMDFGMKVNLATRFTVVDKDGKPAE